MSEHYMLCPTCGNYAHANQKHSFCINCGTKLIDRCPHCSARIVHPIARFCPKCGTKLVDNQQRQRGRKAGISRDDFTWGKQ